MFEEVASRTKLVRVPQADARDTLSRYGREDSELDRLQIDLTAIDPARSVLHQIKSAGIPDEMGFKFLFEPAGTVALIGRPSVLHLLGRTAVTDADHRGLMGMTEYLRRGGKMDAQSINTASTFRLIMGTDTANYGSRLMDGSPMSMGTLQQFVEVHASGTPAQRFFIGRLFE